MSGVMKKILPYDTNILIRSYHHIAFPLGIIKKNANTDIMPWLYSKFVNCAFVFNDTCQFKISFCDGWAVGDNILFRQRVDMFSDTWNASVLDPVILFKRMIDMDCYVSGYYNEEYIPGKKSYNKRYFKHDFLLIGYDNFEKCFYSAGYLADGNFQGFTISYDNMMSSLNSLVPCKWTFDFWKYNDDANFFLDLNRLIQGLSDYVCSSTSIKISNINRLFGMNAISELSSCFINSIEKNEGIDFRYTRTLMEHKYLMMLRIKYLIENGLLSEEYLHQAKIVYDLSQQVHMLGIKYSMKKQNTIVIHMCEKISQTLEIERKYLPKVLLELKNIVEAKSVGDINEKSI